MTPLRICSPKHATRRRLERETFGSELASIARGLGQPFMPWQQDVADVGGEIDAETGLPAYREVIVTVPRQSGKTTLFLSWQIHRCNAPRWSHPQRSAFTAQSGKDARDKWLDEIFPLIRKSRQIKKLVAARGSRLRINEGMGTESIHWRTGSLIRLLSTSSSSGHSKTLHQAVLDEIWHDTDDRREQGLRPAMITVANAQLLVCSTAGTDASVILNRKIKAGRKAVKADTGHGVAYFEFSAPHDWDPDDEESYFTFMPALCPDPPCRCGVDDGDWRHTVSLETIHSERSSMEPNEFARAYGNVPDSAKSGLWMVIDESMWAVLATPDASMADPVALGVWVSPDRDRAAIAAAGGRDGADDRLVEITGRDAVGLDVRDVRDGVDWLAVRLDALAEHRPLVVVTNDRVLADAGRARLATGPDQAAASALLYDSVRAADVHHLGQGELTQSAASARKRVVGQGWVWDQAGQTDVCPIGAASLALWALLTPRVHEKRSNMPMAAYA